MGAEARRVSTVACVLALALALCAACGDHRTLVVGSCAEVAEALLIGVTPHQGFGNSASSEHGLVELKILPRDASGSSLLHGNEKSACHTRECSAQ